MMKVEKLTQAQETLLVPLWARSVEACRPDPILKDRKAVELVEAIDYDFEKFAELKVDHVGFCGRAVIFDTLVRKFLEKHPAATVVEIGPGLATRFERLDNGSVRWFDLDLPQAMEVRQSFFEETERRHFITASVLDQDWVETVKQSEPEHIMFVAEGVFYYLTQEQIINLFSMLADHFPGSSIVFDSQSPLYLRYSNRRHPIENSPLLWSIRRIKEIEKWDSRFKVEESIGFGDSPYYDTFVNRYPTLFRVARFLWPPTRHMFKISLIRLG